jgi:hypothetical protein
MHKTRGVPCHPPGKGSGVAMCPNAPCVPLAWRGLRSCHVPRARHPTGEGSRVATCLMAPGSPPAQGGSRVTAWLRHQDHRPTGLWYRHVSSGSRPASWCGRASEPPHAQCLSPPVCIRAFPKTSYIRSIMTSPGTRCSQHIKCVCGMPYIAYERRRPTGHTHQARNNAR